MFLYRPTLIKTSKEIFVPIFHKVQANALVVTAACVCEIFDMFSDDFDSNCWADRLGGWLLIGDTAIAIAIARLLDWCASKMVTLTNPVC